MKSIYKRPQQKDGFLVLGNPAVGEPGASDVI
jgi:hypothetical protein